VSEVNGVAVFSTLEWPRGTVGRRPLLVIEPTLTSPATWSASISESPQSPALYRHTRTNISQGTCNRTTAQASQGDSTSTHTATRIATSRSGIAGLSQVKPMGGAETSYLSWKLI